MPSRYLYSAYSDIGNERESNEDFVDCLELDDDNLLCIIADGTGSQKNHVQPAALVVENIKKEVKEVFDENKELFLQSPQLFIKMAMKSANNVLGGFKLGNEELYSGYASSVTCCLLSDENHIYIVHTGNTRAYIIRDGVARQFTNDHTRAAELLSQGVITAEDYYVTTDRLRITSGLGFDADPVFQVKTGKIKDSDLILMTTDGVHYAVRPEYFPEIILGSERIEDSAQALITGALTSRYPDNASCIIVVRNFT